MALEYIYIYIYIYMRCLIIDIQQGASGERRH